MVLTGTISAFRGALGFLTRLPVGRDDPAWEEFRRRPIAIVLAGYVVGGILVLPFLLPVNVSTVAIAYLVWIYLVTGINHLDGLADLGDATVVHGDVDRRREVMRDTITGVGAMLAVGLVLVGLPFAALAVAGLPLQAIGIVIAAEVGAKLGMTAVVCFGSAAFEGLGAQLADHSSAGAFWLPALMALPVAGITWPSPAAAVALGGSLASAFLVWWWARGKLGGVSGDVIGATNELARVVGLHAGVVAWTAF